MWIGGIFLEKSISKLLIRQDEVILIKNSDTAKNLDIYGNLFSALQQFKKVSDKDLNNTIFDEKAKVVILNNKKMLIDNIKEEWSGIGCNDEATGDVRCQLCNHLNRWVFYIKNNTNGNELHVGSDCIKHFNGIENIKELVRHKKDIDKKMMKEKRIIEFEQIELPELNFVRDAENKFKSIDVVLPFDLYSNIENSLYNLNYIKTNYISNGGDLKEIEIKYNELKSKHKTLWNDAAAFFKKSKRYRLTCNKIVGKWIKEKNYDVWEKISKNNGMLSEDTLSYVLEPTFIQKHLVDFQKRNIDPDIKIIKLNGNNITFEIKNINFQDGLYFEVSLEWFMQNIGCKCLTSNKFKFDRNDLSINFINASNSNIASILDRLNYILKEIGYCIEISRVTDQLYYKRLALEKKKNKYSNNTIFQEELYKKLSKEYLTNIFKGMIFYDDQNIKNTFKSIFNILELRGKWISKIEKDENEKIAGEAASISKQRDFTPYI